MGGVDKGLIELAGRPMIEHALERLAPRVGAVVISANRHLDVYRRYGWPVVTDGDIGKGLGPLAGIASGMEAATTTYVLTVPCDAPRLPEDLLMRTWAALHEHGAQIAVPHDGIRAQRAFLLLRCELLPDIRDYLHSGGRSVERWLARHVVAETDFSDQPEAFVNVNTPEDLNRQT